MRIGGEDMFVTEACEYTNSFLEFCPDMEIILNIEEDHLDFFKDLADIRASFKRFTQLLPPEGRHEPSGEMLLDRRPTPEDVAAAVVYLLSAESVTGVVLPVDAGQHLLVNRAEAEG